VKVITKALSIRQPWAHLILNGTKPVENRTWKTSYRGLLAIHAGLKIDRSLDYNFDHLERGAIVGYVELTDIVTAHPSEYFTGPYGWVFKNPTFCKKPIPFVGKLGLFEVRIRTYG
jgi:hypothetical protein